MFEPKPKDLPHRIFFPDPIILHGTNQKTLLESALEYLRQPGRVRIEPLYAPAAKASESQ